MVGVPVAVHLVLCALADAMELVVVGQVQRAGLCLHSLPGNEPVIRLPSIPCMSKSYHQLGRQLYYSFSIAF